MEQLHFTSLWISDTQLSGRNLKNNQLYEFLRKTESEYLYLAGHIVDLWKYRKHGYWSGINDRIVNLILSKAQNTIRVYCRYGSMVGLMLILAVLPGKHLKFRQNHAGV